MGVIVSDRNHVCIQGSHIEDAAAVAVFTVTNGHVLQLQVPPSFDPYHRSSTCATLLINRLGVEPLVVWKQNLGGRGTRARDACQKGAGSHDRDRTFDCRESQ